jgi:L-ascorbate metabolism protein UlaG (beta-lactamase superfamily)
MQTKFWFLGFSSFLITTAKGTKILIDPYLNDNPSSPVKAAELEHVDLIIASHGAFDHMKDTAEIALKHGCPVICGSETKLLLVEQGVPAKQITETVWGLMVEQAGIRVRPVVSMHRSSVTLKDGRNVSGLALGFIIYTEDGVRIYNASDTALFSDLKLIGELNKPHIGLINVTIENPFDFLPTFLTGEMTPYEAFLACQWLGLEYAVACHYTNPDCADVREFEALMNNARDAQGNPLVKPVVMAPGGEFVYTKKEE